MKKTKSILALAMACILFLGALFGTGVTAVAEEYEDGEAPFRFNVVYEGYMHLAVGINNYTAGNYALYVYADSTVLAKDTAAPANPIYSTENLCHDEINGIYYFVGHGIAAKNIATDYYYVLVNADNNDVIAFDTYSIYEYCNTRSGYATATAEQKKLYSAVLSYGKAASTILGTDWPEEE